MVARVFFSRVQKYIYLRRTVLRQKREGTLERRRQMTRIELMLEALKSCQLHATGGLDARQVAAAIAAGEAELKREPLTNQRIVEIRKTTNTKDNTAWADTLAFARAIEKETK